MDDFLPSTVPVSVSADTIKPDDFIVLFPPGNILLKQTSQGIGFPRYRDVEKADFLPSSLVLSGTLDGVHVYAAQCPAVDQRGNLVPVLMRRAVGYFSHGQMAAMGRGRELVFWRANHVFCGHCGNAKLVETGHDSGLVCPQCHTQYFPQLAPAVIVAVVRGDKLLLAHNKNFQPGIYGLISGFIEAGEDAEDAIHREIREETGIEVKNIRYFSSQIWPFPNSLMLGYYAEYDSGEAEADGIELEDLGWFDAKHLPDIPYKGSIARRIIDNFIEKSQK